MPTLSPTIDPQLDSQHVWLLEEAWGPWLRREAIKPPPLTSVAGNAFSYLLMAIFLLAGIVAIGFPVNEWNVRDRLQVAGLVVQGKVTELTTTTNDGDTSYYVSFSYPVVALDRVLSGSESISEKFYNTLREGQAISVNYLPEDPQTARIVRPETPFSSAFELLLPAIIGVVFIGMAIVTIFSMRRAAANARDLQTATVLPATLTAISSKIDSDDDIILTYSFRLRRPNGTTFDTMPRPIVANQLRGKPLPPVGTPLAVLYANDGNYRVL